MTYQQAYTAFVAALGALEAAAADLQAAERSQSGRPYNVYALNVVSHLETARVHRSIRPSRAANGTGAMSSYRIRLPDGRVFDVPMPTELKIKRPMSDEEARAAMTRYVAKWTAQALEPLIQPRLPWKEIVRDDAGRIVASIDHPADPPAAETAAKLGAEAAALYMSEVDWS